MSKPWTVQCPVPAHEDELIELAHGGGGLLTHRLIESVFRPAFARAPEDLTHDGAVFRIDGVRVAMTTDSFVVHPLFFPGGDIGSLAIHGTVNDLAMCGAVPLFLSAALVIEEGFAVADLRRVVSSLQAAAQAAGVRIVTGDTKVVERGKADGLYINTTGIGAVAEHVNCSPQAVCAGDAVLLSGDIGRHGIAVMSAREGLEFEGNIESDSAPLAASVEQLIAAGVPLHCLRDPTRGGLATALVEIATARGVDIHLVEAQISISDAVRGACEILGLDPLYVANEGRFVAFVPPEAAADALALLRRGPGGDSAAVIGRVEAGYGRVILRNELGLTRELDMLTGGQLPRIC